MEYITDFNKFKLQQDCKFDSSKPVSRQPSENTLKLFNYLKSIEGKKHLSGQQYLQNNELEDIVYYNLTGKLPAVRGYDFMGVSTCKKPDDQADRAIRWATECGGIVTMCWHWYAPNDMSDYSKGSAFYYKTTDYDTKTCFDLLKAVTVGTPEYEFVITEIDMVSRELKRMSDYGIPVLWRPLHEANGNWFWWGIHSKAHIEAYKKLWYIFFDRMENYHKLDNLIWVWNGQDKRLAVSPDTFDIYGDDIYSEKPYDHSSQKERYLYAKEYIDSNCPGKMIALSECGYIPHPDEMKKDNAMWLWWLPWWGSFVYATENHRPKFDEQGNPTVNSERMTEEFLRELFNHPNVITLDKLPWNKGKEITLPKALQDNLRRFK